MGRLLSHGCRLALGCRARQGRHPRRGAMVHGQAGQQTAAAEPRREHLGNHCRLPQEALCARSERHSVLREVVTLRVDEDEVFQAEVEHRACHGADVAVEEGVHELEQGHATCA